MKNLLLIFLLLTSGIVYAQNTITGKVTSAKEGDPLPGVSVVVKGTNVATTTNLEGNFQLNAPDNAETLVINFLGYLKVEEPIGNRSVINIALQEDVKTLEEVVVIGYGEQKKSVVTGAISSVKASDLENMPITRVEQALQGRTSGLTITQNSGQPGAASTVRVRGTTTIGNSDPLYVVDGVPVEGGIDYLNQSDIESIEVLKDAASQAIYGARAANGVILVTTKKGKSGQLSVNYNGFYGIQQPWRRLNLLNAREYATLFNEASIASGGAIRFEDPASLGEGTDWQDAVFNNSAPIQSHDVSLSGGGEKSTYFASFGYWDQEGIVASSNSKYNRITLRFNSNHKINKAITFGNNIGYTRTSSIGVETNSEWGSPLSRAINMDPLTPVIETDPARLSNPIFSNQPVVRDAYGRPYGISQYISSEILNPVAALQVAQGRGWADKIVSNAFVQIEPVSGLRLRSSIGADLAFWGDEGFNPVFYLNTTNNNTLNRYTRNSNRGLNWLWENTISYSRVLGAHDITLLAGTTAQRNYGENQGGAKTGLPVNHIDDASLNFPVTNENQFFWGGEYENVLSSIFGRVIYNYDEKYLFTGILRRDGSSRFGPNNKYGFFPSASLGWVVSRENFFPTNEVVNFLKVRGSYGIVGNNNIPNFQYLSTVGGGRNYTLGYPNPTLVNGVSPNRISNPDLKWEETSQFNIGFEATVFQDFSLTFDYYTKKTYGMLLGTDVPWYVGNTGPVANIADMNNMGYEFEVGYRKVLGDVNFSLNANASYLKNEVIFLGDERTFLTGQTFGPSGEQFTRTQVGYAVGSFYGFKNNGIFQNQEEVNQYKNIDGQILQPNAKPGDFRRVDVNGDGVISDDDRTIIGNPTPDWTYGLTASANWKGFDITVFGQGVAGNDVFQAIRRYDLQGANWTTAALGRWTGEGTSNTFPRLNLNDAEGNRNFSRSSDFYVEDGSYFRIKILQLGYSLPQGIISKVGLSKLRVYATGNNLLTFTKYSGFDPEIGGGSFGVDRGIYPQARSYMLGINVGF
ncbi:TonB-dependent receptor [Pontibacter sp. SGAir0037]|uniref:SusC/RagA family TonB-linked outer membrane protein n=1 Tax=Pontibacter sp. SGAir0037 TaxID=2571030 RepID=UPI0010CCB82B|nr:TonB-dependent receptor [Pontibacter sp. SGAir0037]QCR23295.1 SusC/RagA family TonB-linked outer membrane protein [Pontibacter sp. SGAir0037]